MRRESGALEARCFLEEVYSGIGIFELKNKRTEKERGGLFHNCLTGEADTWQEQDRSLLSQFRIENMGDQSRAGEVDVVRQPSLSR